MPSKHLLILTVCIEPDNEGLEDLEELRCDFTRSTCAAGSHNDYVPLECLSELLQELIRDLDAPVTMPLTEVCTAE